MKQLMLLGSVLGLSAVVTMVRPQEPASSASELLALLPDGPTKRQFIIDCTGCHTFHSGIAYPNGRKRTEQQWREAITKMLALPAPTPASRSSLCTWIRIRPRAGWRGICGRAAAATARKAAPEVTEFRLPEPRDLPHDVAILADGRVLITGMFTDRMYLLNPADGRFETVAIPVQRANPRAVELSADGRWWVVFGAPNAIGVYDPRSGNWQTHDVGAYPHSIALDSSGSAWFNGHFTADPS